MKRGPDDYSCDECNRTVTEYQLDICNLCLDKLKRDSKKLEEIKEVAFADMYEELAIPIIRKIFEE